MSITTPVLRVRVGPDSIVASCASPARSRVLHEVMQDTVGDAFLMLAIKVEEKRTSRDWTYQACVPCSSPSMRKRNLELLVRYARGVGFEVKLEVELDSTVDRREA